MPGQITVTFQQEGEAEASFVIPAWAAAALDAFVAASQGSAEQYQGKAHVFQLWAIRELLGPLCRRFGCYPPEVLTALEAAESAKADAEAAVAAAMAAAIAPPPEPGG